MAQIQSTLYRDIAEAYATVWTYLDGVQDQARIAVDAIVDVETAGYTPYGGSVGDADAALAIELALLQKYNAAYLGSTTNVSQYMDSVRAINNHVIANSDQTGTSNTKLAYWVNNDVSWTAGGCVPHGWMQMSLSAGYNIDGWNYCSA
jgi:hypothetical protein